jgi:ribosomal protein S18 acetylase RimI-like enzyme
VPDRRPGPLVVAAKIANRISARGPREVLGLAGQRVREWVASSDELIFLVRPTGGEAPDHDSLTFEEATVEDADRYARDVGTDSAATFRKRLSERTGCFLVSSGDVIVHATWMTTAAAWTRELRRYVVPPDGDGYVYESFTRAEARGKGAYPFALLHIASLLAGRGMKRVWVGVEAHNEPSLRAVAKGGFEEAFHIGYRRRLGRLHVQQPAGRLAEVGRHFFSGDINFSRDINGAGQQGER